MALFKKAKLLNDRLTSPSHTHANTRLIGIWGKSSIMLSVKEMHILKIGHNFNLQIGTDQKILKYKRLVKVKANRHSHILLFRV